MKPPAAASWLGGLLRLSVTMQYIQKEYAVSVLILVYVTWRIHQSIFNNCEI